LYVSSAKAAQVQKNLFVENNDQNMSLLDAANKRVYVVGRLTGASTDSIIYSEDNGQTWKADVNWDVLNGTNKQGKTTSITQLKDGTLFCMNARDSVFKRVGTNGWRSVVRTKTIDSLPGLVGALKKSWFISSYDNNLVVLDKEGNYGAYKSVDGGIKWKFMPGLPVGEILFAKQTAFNDVYFVGTKGAGLWRWDGANFRRTDGGMLPNTHIYGVTAKRIIYRTDVAKYFYFAATNNGLYRSENNGYDWVKLSSHPLSEIW
jgi:hypothetical protein